MQRIAIRQDYTLPVERVYDYLAEHEHLGPLFGARITRVRDGDSSRNGAGSVRRLKLPLVPAFEETTVRAEPHSLIEYRITRGSPLRGHVGRMRLTPTDTGCTLDYTIEFGAVLPGLDMIVKAGLDRSLRRALPKVQQLA